MLNQLSGQLVSGQIKRPQNRLCLGVISDTHGLLREEVKERLKGVDSILHAGDVGSLEIIHELKTLAPVYVVRGNCDQGYWANDLPMRELIQIEEKGIYMLHNLNQLDIIPQAADIQVVISGHTHQADCCKRDDVLYVNPGSAGPRRFNLPVTMGFLIWQDGQWQFEVQALNA